MKKITLALFLLSLGMHAQTFPSPYCEITDATDVIVEEIASVDFGGTTITNSDVASVLINETATVIAVTQEDTYTMEVTGNTYGPFDTDIVAFIDWNQNEVLDDAGEIFEIGTLTNTDGTDGISVIFDMVIPTDAVLGETRIRLTKTYTDSDSPAQINPCGIEFDAFGQGIYPGYGQALDFTLLVEAPIILPFPSPYCEITDADNVIIEEISSVNFAGTNIANTDATTVLIDETATVVNIALNETYALEVAGNTYGPFDTDIVAFIDWNQNDILDDAGEIYEIGTLINTNGTDGVSVSMDILVPTDAVLGETRIRLTKTYTDSDSPAEINPCGIEFDAFGQGIYPGYGQALDFTLNITPLSTDTFEVNALSVYPIPTKDYLNISYKSTIQSVTIFNMLGQEVYAQNTSASKLELQVSELATGTYLVKLQTEVGTHTFRFLKH
ncbi:T9SS type A sorting domain-containing protein [Bizionia sp.]|uniref:T9SS type A sorting domain-containing protein n=1 Tax=Bizionia sp. TaxID=1954480 RepID=UPI003A91D2A7